VQVLLYNKSVCNNRSCILIFLITFYIVTTVTLKINESKAVMLSGGPLKDIYVFEQLHFHWGENDFEGSEDLINNHSFPMEMHAVFYKEDYNSFKEALNYNDGLAILAYLYEVRNYLYLKILIDIFTRN